MLICPHCGKEFDETKQSEPGGLPTGKVSRGKWYYTNYWVIFAVLCAGPLALPLIWFNPNYKQSTKWIYTILIFIGTIIIIFLFVYLVGILIEQLQNLTNMKF
jgi:hypothetical protein